jgi:hypothetical protein
MAVNAGESSQQEIISLDDDPTSSKSNRSDPVWKFFTINEQKRNFIYKLCPPSQIAYKIKTV